MVPTPSNSELVALETSIIAACEKHELAHIKEHNYRPVVIIGNLFIKFDSYQSMYPQFQTQMYVAECAKRDKNAPRIPNILHFFHRDQVMAYVVMEYMELRTVSIEELAPRAALALQWLWDLPVPNDLARIGPLGGGRARHELFKNYRAPLDFSGIEAVEKYLNKLIPLLSRKGKQQLMPVHISDERLVFTQSDMDASNFGVDDQGNTCLFDFGLVGLLPESFANFTVMSSNRAFTMAVAQSLGLRPRQPGAFPNLDSMGQMKSYLWMLADPRLGLDNNGDPKS